MNWLKKNLVSILLVMTFLTGVGLLIYPTFSDYWNSFHQSRAIMSYAADVSKIPSEEYEEVLEEAQAYNARLAEQGVLWEMTEEEREAYNRELNTICMNPAGQARRRSASGMRWRRRSRRRRQRRRTARRLPGKNLPVCLRRLTGA